MSSTLDWTSASFLSCRKEIVLTLTSVAAKNATETVVAPVMGYGEVCFWREFGVSSKAVFFGAFGRNLASVAVIMF
jgi:hypothetical protein